MKKTKKRVKFELPYASSGAVTFPRQQDEAWVSSQPRKMVYMDPRIPRIPRIPSPHRKLRRYTRSVSSISYSPLSRPTKLEISRSSSLITQPKRSVAPPSPDLDKTISYLARSRNPSGHLPTPESVNSYVSSRNSRFATPIMRSPRMSLDLKSWSVTNLRSKSPPPIDVSRRFCTTRPENLGSSVTRSLRLSVASKVGRDADGRLSPAGMVELKMLRPRISSPGIPTITRRDSALSDIVTSRDNRFIWKTSEVVAETPAPSSSNSAAAPKEGSPPVMEVQYLTERIIVALFPSDGTDAQYRTGLKDATVLFRRKHPERYKIFNVSKKRSDLGRLHPVVELGWPQELAPPLDRLCSICKLFENWLSANPENVVVIHCKGGCSRAAIVSAAYMHYVTICSADESIGNRFALQRFSERYLGADGQPSHKRYVKYFSALLSGRTKIQPATVYLHHIILTNFSGRNILFKIYERMQPVHTTSLTTVNESSTSELDDLPLRGDILVKCFQRTSTAERAPFFRCQFNTCTFDLSTRDGNTYRLRFYREELDDIFNDCEVNPQAAIEFIFLTEVPKSGASTAANGAASGTVRRSIVDYSRADSYENFDKEEEDRSEPSAVDGISGVEYAEIHRPADSTDSGIGSDSANTSKEKGGMPPLPPPKPRVNLETRMNDHYSELTRGNEQVVTRAHSVLPASVRPSPTAQQPASPSEERPAPPRAIEPDLVAKDRYDPASKCFSYVPARALSEHFTAPRKPQRPKTEEPAAATLNVEPSPSEIASVPVKSTELQRRPETPKWEDDIDKISNSYLFGQRSGMVDISATSSDFDRSGNGPIANSTPKAEFSKPEASANVEEKPIMVEQAKRVSKRRKTKYGSYKTLNDDAYNSDMDDLCDPDFYLTYTPQSTAPVTPITSTAQPNKINGDLPRSNNRSQPPMGLVVTGGRGPEMTSKQEQNFTNNAVAAAALAAANGPGSKSAELPRKPLKDLSQQDQATLDVYFSSPKPATSLSNINQDREAFRMRNCRSATSAPFYREYQGSRLFAHDRYDSLTDAENADDWLNFQLRKLKAKRENNPEVLRRKRQEKLLLEELKHVSDDRQAARGRDERTYSVEGYGQRSDPLTEYRMEEERLQNVRTPYNDNGRVPDELPCSIRRVMPPKPTDIVRHKPPTPPLRARSRSPPSSPYPRRSRTRTPFQESVYQRERNQISRNDSKHDIGDFEDNDFSHLRNIIKENNSGIGNAHVDYSSSASSMKSILKKRDVQNGTPSPMVNRRGSTPVEEWSLGSASNRAATPAFPVRRETPLPYHPLLFEGAKDVMPPAQPINNITYRSPSPRSGYYAQSHRTSLSSTEPGEVIHHHPLFVKDTSKYWYKPTISREEAINMLRDKPPGTFVVRDSNSFPGAFGLAVKVATPPPGVHPGDGTELVRHFLIEPSPKGVKLKGCNNEPVFGTLSALVYQHSITPLALPTKLLLPDYDPASTPEHISAAQALLQQGAACNVTYVVSLDTESLTGPEAVRRCISEAFELLKQKMVQPVSVHFKVSAQGVTITDNTRRLFFRRHYPVQSVTYAGLDPSDRRWDNSYLEGSVTTYVKTARMFAFVARKIGSRTDNACHVFAELEPEQPATAVVNFITKVMMGRR